MRLLQSLAISVPAWILCFLLLDQHLLWTDNWPDLLVLLVFVVSTVLASALAFMRCDLRVSLSSSQTSSAPDRASSRANIAFLLTGLALGLFPTLIWVTKLDRQRDEARKIAYGVEIVVAGEDLEPGDTLSMSNMASTRILRRNLTNLQFYPDEAHKLVGAKARTHIPARTPVIAVQIEGFSLPPEPKRNAEAGTLKDLRI